MMGRVAEAVLAQNGGYRHNPNGLKGKEVTFILGLVSPSKPQICTPSKNGGAISCFCHFTKVVLALSMNFEILTWRQLGFHNDHYRVNDIDGYFPVLEQFIQRAN